MYRVLEFDDGSGGGLGLVRDEWLTPRKQQCYWPPFKLSHQYNKALTEGYQPDEKWSIFNVSRIFYSTDDILKARKKLKLAEEESDVVTDLETNVKRKRKRNYKYISSDDDGEWNNCNKKQTCDNETNFDCGDGDDESSSNSVSLLDSLKRFHKSSKNKYPLPPGHSEHPQPVDTSVSVGSEFSNSVQHVNLLSPCSSNMSNDDNCISQQITKGFDVIAKHLARLEKRVDDIICKQESVLKAAFPQVTVSPTLPSNIKLPCETLEHLLEIENWLSDNPDNETSLKIFLSFTGGRTVSSIVRRCLEKLFTNKLAIEFNWTGKSDKKALKSLKIVHVLCEAVRINKYTGNATDDEIQRVIKSWFRFTKDRDGGREARRREPRSQ